MKRQSTSTVFLVSFQAVFSEILLHGFSLVHLPINGRIVPSSKGVFWSAIAQRHKRAINRLKKNKLISTDSSKFMSSCAYQDFLIQKGRSFALWHSWLLHFSLWGLVPRLPSHMSPRLFCVIMKKLMKTLGGLVDAARTVQDFRWKSNKCSKTDSHHEHVARPITNVSAICMK